jgi:hypothetical protein
MLKNGRFGLPLTSTFGNSTGPCPLGLAAYDGKAGSTQVWTIDSKIGTAARGE